MLSQRNFLGAAGATVATAQTGRPNILWITCEYSSPERLGCYGSPVARTPNLDGLAASGVRYDRAFSTSGVCAPTRSAIITGMYATTLGSHHMRSTVQLPAHVKCFSEYLRQAGYYCTNNVKTDYNFATPASAWDDVSDRAHWRNGPSDARSSRSST
jgi:N-sulfoglucosamine sulfohydrolase